MFTTERWETALITSQNSSNLIIEGAVTEETSFRELEEQVPY